MKERYNFKNTLLISILCLIIVVGFTSCLSHSSEKVIADSITSSKTSQSNNSDNKTNPDDQQDDCLNAEYPENKCKTRVNAGVMNGKAIYLPKPDYPVELKEKKIAGKVEANIVIDEEGKVIWAEVENGRPQLQKLVKKVVCKSLFKPPTLSGKPYSVRGLIIYKFILPE